MVKYPNFEIVGTSGHGRLSGDTDGIKCTDHDGHTEFIRPHYGVTAQQAAACWFELTYKVPGAKYSRSDRSFELAGCEDDFRVEGGDLEVIDE